MSEMQNIVPKLTYQQRKRLPDSSFAIPSERKYPIENKAHARNALARVSSFGTRFEKMMVCQAVAQKYPSINEKSCPYFREVQKQIRYHRIIVGGKRYQVG